jgi:hypothetical protein
VLNFLLHRPQDAAEIFDTLIKHPAVQKCNFTGSTAVGRSIAQKAGSCLKPVLLELGGKNCAIVLEDADLERAAEAIVVGATLNVCLVVVLHCCCAVLTWMALIGRADLHVDRYSDRRKKGRQ